MTIIHRYYLAGGYGASVQAPDLQHGQDEDQASQRRRGPRRRRQVDGRPYPRLIWRRTGPTLRIFHPTFRRFLCLQIFVAQFASKTQRLECTDLTIHPRYRLIDG